MPHVRREGSFQVHQFGWNGDLHLLSVRRWNRSNPIDEIQELEFQGGRDAD